MSTSTAPAPSPSLVRFASSVLSLLRSWSALTLVLSHNPTTGCTVESFAEEIVSLFLSEETIPSQEAVEDFVLGYFDEDLSTSLEDGSEVGVARDLRMLWTESLAEGEGETMRRVREVEGRMKGRKVEVKVDEDEEVSGSDSEESGEDDVQMDVMEPSTKGRTKPEPVVDEDGFTLVQKKR
ncbi:hypothetical protein BT69DRAFT_1289251 [Atractiella rhizophila]|nr:hypothetical protein BT69DRAFT_1289251 [Atractiella rhizophila]